LKAQLAEAQKMQNGALEQVISDRMLVGGYFEALQGFGGFVRGKNVDELLMTAAMNSNKTSAREHFFCNNSMRLLAIISRGREC
jgi:hypothetical protein